MGNRSWIAAFTVLFVGVVCFALFVVESENEYYKTHQEEPVDVSQIKDVPAHIIEKQEEPVAQPMVNEGYAQTLTKSMGVYMYAGRRETYYSSRVARHININEWWADNNGFWRTSEGYFVVSSSDYAKGTIINISMGQAKVLDTGCPHNVVDIYCNW